MRGGQLAVVAICMGGDWRSVRRSNWGSPTLGVEHSCSESARGFYFVCLTDPTFSSPAICSRVLRPRRFSFVFFCFFSGIYKSAFNIRDLKPSSSLSVIGAVQCRLLFPSPTTGILDDRNPRFIVPASYSSRGGLFQGQKHGAADALKILNNPELVPKAARFNGTNGDFWDNSELYKQLRMKTRFNHKHQHVIE